MKKIWIPAALLSALAVAAVVWFGARNDDGYQRDTGDPIAVNSAGSSKPTLIGGAICATCHAEQAEAWSGSHHDLAMQHASDETVLGDFSDATFTHFDVTSTFFMDGNRYMVRTDGPDGEVRDFEVRYTFGVSPLQQYLIEFPDGRVQPLGIAWDSRRLEDGGQRWFHLYPDEPVGSSDSLHWTKPSQNWNYMCAECHVTGLAKNYDAQADAFATSWSEIDVACEACHGPGSFHVQWAQSDKTNRDAQPNLGLMLAFDERHDVTWPINPETGSASRSQPNRNRTEIEVCARCHSRRGVLTEEYEHGRPLMDSHRPALLTEDLYYPDGQILDEVYVYGSFLQSRMFHAGVTCSDCHDPHSLELRAPGNDVCLGCHTAERFAAKSHHHHETGSDGAQCVACHMPDRTYMVVDPRRDHSIRIPRPDLSERFGTPNACTACHEDRTNAWASTQITDWYGDPAPGHQRFAEAIFEGRRGSPEAPPLLIDLLANEEQPGIARATAASLLGQYAMPQAIQAISNSLYDNDPLVRMGGLQALAGFPANVQLPVAQHLLEDPVLAVRIEAAHLLAAVPANALKSEQRAALKLASAEYLASVALNADRPESQVNLGIYYLRTGQPQQAEAAYRQAIKLDPQFAAAYANLADLYRQTGGEAEAQIILRQGLDMLPDDAGLHHALGLALVRANNMTTAVEELSLAAELAPDDPRFAYVYAIALDGVGDTGTALTVLEEAQQRNPFDVPILEALINYSMKTGDTEDASAWTEKLAGLRRRAQQAMGQADGS